MKWGFSTKRKIGDEALAQLLVENQEKKLAVMPVKSLHHAHQLQESIDIAQGHCHPDGILPTVSVEFG